MDSILPEGQVPVFMSAEERAANARKGEFAKLMHRTNLAAQVLGPLAAIEYELAVAKAMQDGTNESDSLTIQMARPVAMALGYADELMKQAGLIRPLPDANGQG